MPLTFSGPTSFKVESNKKPSTDHAVDLTLPYAVNGDIIITLS